MRTGSLHFMRPPPPPHPIYPDRYRPNGIGDNTKRKRKSLKIKAPPNRSVELKFHPIPPLMRKRPPERKAEENLIDLTTSSDNEKERHITDEPNWPSKRQKRTGSKDGKTTVGLTYGPTETRQVGGAPSNAQSRPVAPMKAEAEILKQLILVRTKLQDARQQMNTCQGAMKKLFDDHYEKFDDDNITTILQKLSDCMNKVFDNGRDGAAEVDKAVEWLDGRKESIT